MVRGVRWLKGAAVAVARVLLAGAVIALVLLVLQLLVGLVLVEYDALFR